MSLSSRRPTAGASSRPPSSRQPSTSNSRMDPPPVPHPSSKIARPASALSLSSNTSTRGEEEDRKRVRMTGGNGKPANGSGSSRAGGGKGKEKEREDHQDGENVNIEVVVRCRGRSEKEKLENSPMIVTTLGTITTSVSIETGPLATVVPSLTAPPATRTYHFDQVFSPEADQEIVFDSVVKGTLDEVLEGYNCTLFAYGQTGTGKTYTMQGDLSFNSVGDPSADAGIIPRTLHRLFTLLDASGSEYSVKISFVELYNEEIRDLLSSSPHADSHHHTAGLGGGPVGMGGPVGGVAALGGGGLKIFEDAKTKGGRGVWIEGLEECLIRNTDDGLKLLSLGSKRRETGETLMNKVSSRSHSIFAVTIHMKESSPTGDDLLKVGKLNLVDLAGSEDISRSGAVDKRAVEAGNINKSLLTLGRVINALVEKGKHIPYRDSNLTRLLKDSLGGGTKTRIIATVSPSASNREETLSTLDYATRATRITNKPEINQRMTKGVLIKEYVMEIERLKADLLASREKNGIFLSQETWTDLDTESRLRETQAAEAKSRELILSTKITRLEAELLTLTDRFRRTESDLKVTRQELVVKEGELEVREVELVGVRGELEVEKVVAGVYETGEERLDGVAGKLKGVAKESLGDLDEVFGKLGRKTKVENANASTIGSFASTTIRSTTEQLSTLQEYQQAQNELSADMIASLESARASEIEKLQSIQQTLSTYLVTLSERTTALGSVHADSAKERQGFYAIVEDVRSSIQSLLKISGAGLRDSLSRSADELVLLVEEKLLAIGALLNSTVESVELPIGKVTKAIANETSKNNAFVESNQSGYAEMSNRLSALESAIALIPAKRHLARLDLKAQLTEAVASIFSSFEETQSAADAADLARFEAERLQVVEGLERHQKETRQRVEELNGVFEGLGKTMREMREAMREIAERGPAEVEVVTDGLRSGLVDLREAASSSMTSMMAKVESASNQLSEASSKSVSKATKLQKKQDSTLQDIASSSNEACSDLRQQLDSLQIDTTETSQHLISSQNTSSRVLDSYSTLTTTALNTLSSSTQSLITTQLLTDVPTGSTPRKRNWDVPETWERSGSRSAVIAQYQRVKAEGGGSGQTMVSRLEEVVGEEGRDEELGESVASSSSTLGESPSYGEGFQKKLGGNQLVEHSSPVITGEEDGWPSSSSSPTEPAFPPSATQPSHGSSPIFSVRSPTPPPPSTASISIASAAPTIPPPMVTRHSSSRSISSSSSNAENAAPSVPGSKTLGGKGRAPPRDRSTAGGTEALTETRMNLPRSVSGRGSSRRG